MTGEDLFESAAKTLADRADFRSPGGEVYLTLKDGIELLYLCLRYGRVLYGIDVFEFGVDGHRVVGQARYEGEPGDVEDAIEFLKSLPEDRLVSLSIRESRIF